MRKGLVLFIVLLIGGLSVRAVSPDLVVTPIWRDGQVLVSFELSEGLTPEIRDTIQSGLSTTFYEIDEAETTTWFPRTLASMTMTASVHFDNLTRRYQLSRAIDGRLEDSVRPRTET
jgi:hypothetical protein